MIREKPLPKFRRACARFTAALCAAGAFVLPAMAEQAVPALLEPVGVKSDTAVAYVGEISEITVYDGSVAPYVEELYFPIDGQVSEIHVIVGQTVQAGDPLVALDQEAQEERREDLLDAIEDARTDGAFADALAEIDIQILATELEQLRRQSPADETAIALKELEIETAQLNLSLEQELRAMELERMNSELETLETQLEEGTLYAPFDGRILFGQPIEKGSGVTAYDPILYLADDSRLSITADYISSAYTDSADEIYAWIGAKQYEITPTPIDMSEYLSLLLSGETLTSHFTFEQSDESIQSGMYAAICLVNNSVPDALLVPTNALFRDAGSRYVYEFVDGQRVRRTVEIGVSTEWLTQITAGLEEGAVVYVAD